MGLWIKPTQACPAIVLGRAGTVLLAQRSYYITTSPEPLAAGCPIPREPPTHHGEGASKRLVFWHGAGFTTVDIGGGPWAAWCAEGEGIFDLMPTEERML